MIVDIHTHYWRDCDLTGESESSAEQAGGVTPRFHMTPEMHLEETAGLYQISTGLQVHYLLWQ